MIIRDHSRVNRSIMKGDVTKSSDGKAKKKKKFITFKIDKIANPKRMSGGGESAGKSPTDPAAAKRHDVTSPSEESMEASEIKRRLDSCISELNEIITDVSFVFSKN